MAKGLDTFQKYFKDYEEQYVLIGGAACDILFEKLRNARLCTMKKILFICHGNV
ncbi:hypothetical protein [Ruminococcus sp.]|uniref:hypothetical protein n=1 Tax=Ruminococcus sp. TaxID=41978 RepID=UPI00352830CA